MKLTSLMSMMIALMLCIGCSSEPGSSSPEGSTEAKEPEHPEEGIHGGPLAEWGNEEYHPELVLDVKKKQATVYVLDSTAKKAAAIPVKSITLTLTAEEPALKLEMKADPQKDDPEGKSSRFVIMHEKLGSKLDPETITVFAKFNDKPYHSEFHDHHEEEK